MTAVPGLADLVAPLEAGQFHSDVLGRAPRRFTGRPGRFASLLRWTDLDRVLRQHRLDFPRLRLALDGEVVPAHSYTEMVQTRRTGLVPRVLSAPFAERLRAGATLVLDSVNELVEPVGDLAARLEHDLRERVQVNLYAGWGTTHGFDVHWDDHDAFIIQIAGRKRWRLHGITRPAPLQRDVELPPRPEGEPLEDFLLEDGDVLYVPRGHWHDVSAVGEESLHLTIGFNPATGVDLVAWLADQVRADELFREDLPRFAGPGDRTKRAAQLRQQIAELMTDDLVDRFLSDRDAQAPAHPRIGLPWSATAGLLPPGDDFAVRLLAPRAALEDGEGTVALVAAGKRLVFAAIARPVLAALLDGSPHDVRVLAEAAPSLDGVTLRALLGELVTQGLLSTA
ncbi:cupin domain-containing protein [Amycolatopsis sp., V23-08]|uniref:Cupin domain-containing protein n=1 Tax=Amycolatopsis heterodermiae TaxID=3110235 RepID=A0ABU5R2P2_9PSEU|nr:cupin domain-containing protein [Amycolatopsis sp., V23-08]MEA5360463.1 cupin domain-containing protein [Amycolatopsis sp., V23-08]